jgi:hypothetical protein
MSADDNTENQCASRGLTLLPGIDRTCLLFHGLAGMMRVIQTVARQDQKIRPEDETSVVHHWRSLEFGLGPEAFTDEISR